MIVEHRFAHIPQDARRGRAWIASLAPLVEARLEPGITVPLDAFHRYHHLGEAVLAVYETPAQTIERTERLVDAQGLDHLVVRTHASGRARIAAGPLTVEARPGDVVFLDLARAVRIETEPSVGASLVVPLRLLGNRAGDVAGRHGKILAANAHPMARLVAGHLLHLAACLPMTTPEQVRLLVSATFDLCRALLPAAIARGVGDHDRPPEVATGLAMRRFIEDNLQRVDVPMLMARFGLSRAPLYRRFAAEGGVHAYICDRRVVAAMRRLTRPDAAPRPMVARLAHEVGFANARVFSRAFHRKYGLWPAEVEPSLAPRGGSASDPPLTWLRDL